jgi:hypothetical protein
MRVFEVSEGKTHFFKIQIEFDTFFTTNNDKILLLNHEGNLISSFSSKDEICFYFNFQTVPNSVEHTFTPEEAKSNPLNFLIQKKPTKQKKKKKFSNKLNI